MNTDQDHVGSSGGTAESLAEAAHTPGPWEESGVWVMSASADVMVAKADYHEVAFDVARANARLIAAAPQLLEAVKAFMALDATFSTTCVDGLAELAAKRGRSGDMARAVQLARAALAKATA